MGGSPKPKDPPPVAPPPTETSLDVQEEQDATKRKASKRAGRTSTIITELVNAVSGNTVLG